MSAVILALIMSVLVTLAFFLGYCVGIGRALRGVAERDQRILRLVTEIEAARR